MLFAGSATIGVGAGSLRGAGVDIGGRRRGGFLGRAAGKPESEAKNAEQTSHENLPFWREVVLFYPFRPRAVQFLYSGRSPMIASP